MLFNTIDFAAFLVLVFSLYWFVFNKRLLIQNALLLVASYFFYASWDYRFLFLLIFSTFLDFFTGIKIYEGKTERKKSFWLWTSIIINLGFLGVFKYYNFFSSSFASVLSGIGLKADLGTLNIILPLGISFYTFHGLSYVIDIYKKSIVPERNFINYSIFVSFFPLLVAGPIERATHLLPQILRKREFNYAKASDGLRQILWGLFKKIVIADNCAIYANDIFKNYQHYSGFTLLFGALFFAFQIYCDFSGYSDIALGTARLFGIELLRNFSFPYFSRDIAEFWRRWHISLSSWFRDYIYIPLGGSKGGAKMKVRNTLIIFLLSGFWHGANWTFLIWGLLNAIYIMPSIIFNTHRNNLDIVAKGKYFPTAKEFVSMGITFGLTLFAWIFFRSQNIGSAFSYISKLFMGIFMQPGIILASAFWIQYTRILCFILILLVVEWLQRDKNHALEFVNKHYLVYKFRWVLYLLISVFIFLYGDFNKTEFIYFAF